MNIILLENPIQRCEPMGVLHRRFYITGVLYVLTEPVYRTSCLIFNFLSIGARSA